jgi:hypothetical protein
VNSKSVDWSCLGLLIDDIQSDLRPIPQWRMQFVGREGNQIAHRLSCMATSRILNEKWFDQPTKGIITYCTDGAPSFIFLMFLLSKVQSAQTILISQKLIGTVGGVAFKVALPVIR